MNNKTFVDVNISQVAGFIGAKLAPLSIPSANLRPDIGNVQVDPVIIVENYEEHPAIRFEMDMALDLNISLNVRLKEFVANPNQYMADLLENVQGIRYAALHRRAGRQDEVSRVMAAMQKFKG